MSEVVLRLTWATHQFARYACEHWHYSRSLPCPPLVIIGVEENGQAIGVVIFSRGANKSLYRPYGLQQTEGAELTRVALPDHTTPTSRIVAIALRMLKRHCPGLRLVVSFADPAQGHVGTLYQALGALNVGDTEPSEQFIDASGKRWHRRMISADGWKTVYGRRRRVLTLDQVERLPMPGKHRYLFPLDAETRERLLPMSKPYPRRSSADSGTPEDHSGRGGARPTDRLPSTHESGGGKLATGGVSHSSHPEPSLQGRR